MNAAGKGIAVFFGGAGVLMVLVGREVRDRGGATGDAASVFVMIGMIWTAVAIFLVMVFFLVGRATAQTARHQSEQLRDTSGGPDVADV